MQSLDKIKLNSYFIAAFFLFISCNSRPAPSISFYYWKTRFALNDYEKEVLEQNSVQSLYVRYFDIDLDPASGQPKPVAIINFATASGQKTIIPVIYIKNRVFEKTDSSAINILAKHVLQLIAGVNEKNKIVTTGVQFDCDWTEKTRNVYFLFLQHYKKISGQPLSATIRLHQVKYSQRTGIPPVEEGVLMFYNMGTITAGDVNSIYEEKNALKYISSLKHYPLPLGIALPIFSWAIGMRNGKVQYLLNKMYAKDFESDSNFVRIGEARFRAKHSFFKAGYYVQENDEIKVENIGLKDLRQMTDMLKKNNSQPVKKVIFYDLDSSNFINYESNIFQTVSQDLR